MVDFIEMSFIARTPFSLIFKDAVPHEVFSLMKFNFFLNVTIPTLII